MTTAVVSCASMGLSDPNPEEERQRLRDLYAGMADGELEQLAGDAPSLSEVARQALRAEIARRGLAVAVTDQISGSHEDEVQFRELVTIRKFRDLPEALLAKGSLDSAGIECFLGDDNMVRMDWFISNLLGGIKLRVRAEDVEAAVEILSQPIPEGLEVEGVGEYRQPRCPNCQSLEVSFEELNKLVAYGSAYLNVPVPLQHKGWRCQECGHRWEADEEQEEPPLAGRQ